MVGCSPEVNTLLLTPILTYIHMVYIRASYMLMETSVIRLREVIAIAETTLTQISMLVAQRGPRKFPMTAGSSNVQNAKNTMLGIL